MSKVDKRKRDKTRRRKAIKVEPKLRLYHGTNYKYLDAILKKGIIPRKKKKSQWEEYPSNPDMVYLTTAYPFYFATNTLDGDEDEKAIVFEIDGKGLSENLFYPDEDFIVQGISDEQRKKWGLPNDNFAKTMKIRNSIEDYKTNWKTSINALGNVCYKGIIPPESITRYCVVDFKKRVELYFDVGDPVISIGNYGFLGEHYRRLVEWFFGDCKNYPTKNPIVIPNDLTKQERETKYYKDLIKMAKNQKEYVKKQSKDRTGIEVVNIK